ncbi:MAG: deoxyribonuclease IV [Phycisphaerae bacterium]
MPRFGAHLSIAGGVERAVERARAIRADCLQLFVKPPQQWRFQPLHAKDAARFRSAAKDAGLAPLVGHASYLVNLATPDETLHVKSLRCLLAEWDRTERLGLAYLVLHPGSHTGSGEAAGLERVARALDRLHRERPGHRSRILLETTAGAGSTLGGRLEHLKHLVETCEAGPSASPAVEAGDRLGIAIDTCHLFAAGYDLRTKTAVEETLGKIDEAVGLRRVGVVHVNDAKGSLGSRLDRHQHIGRGRIGREGFRALVNHPALAALPFILETPKRDARGRKMDPVNLGVLRRLAKG